MNRHELNCLRVVWDELKKLEKRLEGNTFLYDVDECKYIRGKLKQCIPNLEILLGPNPAQSLTSELSSLSLSSSWCPYSGKDRGNCLCPQCSTWRDPNHFNASSLSGPEVEPPQDDGLDSTSKTPAEPDAANPATTPSLERTKPNRLVYVAGPYWHHDPERRVLHTSSARLLAVRVAEAGFFPVTPHLNTAGFEDITDLPESFYLQGDLLLLEKCDAMILAPGHEKSKGTQREIKFARERAIPVFTEIDKLESAYARA